MATQVHIVPHFHWDREWYFTAEESKILLVNDMEEVLTMLETKKDYPYFVLDGQTAVLEDYFSIKPENKERVKQFVEAGKLIIGPWYTQTDEMVVGGESIVRNLLYGQKDCAEFGPSMMIGYLPDSFGQSARMPQILNGFGITRSMFWRGASERKGSHKTEFIWRDDEGSQVTVLLLPLGYAIGKYLPTDPQALEKRMKKYLPVLDAGATTEHILLPNGHDQMPVQKNIDEVMESLKTLYPERNFFLSRYEHVFDEVEQQKNLDVLHGEFLDGKYMRVHRSIYSSRADLKAMNTRIEHKITNILEPLASIAYKLGFAYYHGLIEAIWKELLKNHAHDSIGCCCSDKVHRAIADRFFLAEERTDGLIEFYKRKITDTISCEIALDKLTVFNLLPYERFGVFQGEVITKMKNFTLMRPDGTKVDYQLIGKEIVDAGLIDRQIVHYGDYDPFIRYTIFIRDSVPSMGYQTYLLMPQEGLREITGQTKENPVLENAYYRINIEQNGTLTIFDKKELCEYKNVLLVEDGSDDGDGYDYSELKDDFVLTSADAHAVVTCTDQGWKQKAVIAFSLNIPKNIQSRKEKKRDGLLKIQFTIELYDNSHLIGVQFAADNHAMDHRVRVLLPGGKAEYSVCDNQFGRICRPVYDTAMDVWESEHWSERPDSIYPFLNYVTTDSTQGVAVITDSVREYEIIRGECFGSKKEYDTIALTMFRSVGVLGKEELCRRPGRPSGIKMETPDSQLLGNCCFDFSITTVKENLEKTAKEAATPLVTYNKMPYNAMKLNPSDQTVPYCFSLFKEEKHEIIISTLKKAERENGLILRFYNGGSEKKSWKLSGSFTSMEAVNLNEQRLDNQDNDGSIEVNQIETWLLK